MHTLALVFLSALVVRGAGAQSPSCIGSDLSRYPAPSAPLQDDRPMDGTTRYEMTVQQPHDGAPRPLGTMTVTQTTARCGSNDVVRRIIVYDYGTKDRVVDTTMSIALTLAPIMERTHKRSGDITLDFARGAVRGSMSRAGKPRAIRDTLPAPAFNSTDLELVVRSLALTYGLSTTLEIYDPEFGGARADSIAVLRLDPPRIPGTEGSWVVRSRDRRLESTYRISEHSRKLLSADIRADTTRYRIVDASRVPGATHAIPVTLPGSPALRTPALVSADSRLRMRSTPTPGGAEREIASVTVSTFAPHGDTSARYVTSSWTATGTQYDDTLALRLPSLSPIWERSTWNGTTNSITYDGAHVHAIRHPRDSAATVFDTTFAHPVFAFVELETILSALPLEQGFETILPLYSENDRALEMDTVTVLSAGHSAATGHATWTVRFADPAIVATYEIDDVTRQTLAYALVSRRSGARLRRVRST